LFKGYPTLASVFITNFEWDFYRAKGKGGQKKNKTESACRCRHLPSGALATGEESRSQHTNKRKAFERITKTKKFKKWIRLEVARQCGESVGIEDAVDLAMQEHNLKIESFKPSRKK